MNNRRNRLAMAQTEAHECGVAFSGIHNHSRWAECMGTDGATGGVREDSPRHSRIFRVTSGE